MSQLGWLWSHQLLVPPSKEEEEMREDRNGDGTVGWGKLGDVSSELGALTRPFSRTQSLGWRSPTVRAQGKGDCSQ